MAEAHEVVAVMVVRVDRSAPELFGLIDRCGFTRREADVARALTAGRSNREIARQLAISPHTVRHHLERVFAKLGVSTRNEALIELLRRPDYEGDVTGPE